jgi:hypothetical protein
VQQGINQNHCFCVWLRLVVGGGRQGLLSFVRSDQKSLLQGGHRCSTDLMSNFEVGYVYGPSLQPKESTHLALQV